MASAPKKKALKIGRALKRLPARAVGRGNSGGAFAPIGLSADMPELAQDKGSLRIDIDAMQPDRE